MQLLRICIGDRYPGTPAYRDMVNGSADIMVSKETRNKISGKRTSRLQQDIIYDVKRGRVDRNYGKGEYITAVTLNDDGIEEGVISGNDPEILTEDGYLKKGTIYQFSIEGKIIKSISYIDHGASEDADASEEVLIGCLYDSESATKERKKKGNMRYARSIYGAISRVLKAAPDVDAALLEQNLRAAFKAAEAGIALPDGLGIEQVARKRTIAKEAKKEVVEPSINTSDEGPSITDDPQGSLREMMATFIRRRGFPEVWAAFTAVYSEFNYNAADFPAVVEHRSSALVQAAAKELTTTRHPFAIALESMGLEQRKAALDEHYATRKQSQLYVYDTDKKSSWVNAKSAKPTPEEFQAWLDVTFPDRREIGMVRSDLKYLDEPAFEKVNEWSKARAKIPKETLDAFGLPPKSMPYDPVRDADAPTSVTKMAVRRATKILDRARVRAAYHRG